MISPHRSQIPPIPNPARQSQPNDRRAVVLRARLFGTFILLLFACLITRLWFLQIVNGDDYHAKAEANQARRIQSRAPRGAIVDCRGDILAANRSRFAVYATPDIVKDTAVLDRVAELLGMTQQDIAETIKEKKQNRYDPVRIALDVPMTTVTQIEEYKPFLAGVSTEPEPVRWYPHGSLAGNLLGTMGRINENEFRDLKNKGLGYFNDDFLGKTGIEDQYERYLHGAPGGTDVQIDARGRKVRTMNSENATPGSSVQLALDAKVQQAAEQVFAQNHYVGAAVAINPQTGAVLSMVSAPTFDPDDFATGIKAENWKPLSTNPNHPLIDRTLDAMYPPGSTFKPIVAAAGLETGAMTTHSGAYCPGSYHLGKARFGCWSVHGSVNFYSAMAGSCDVFFYIYGQAIGPDRISTYAKAFGLAEKTGIDLPSEDIGSIPSPAWKKNHFKRYGPEYSQWFGGDTLHMSIGQGDVLTTPLQMARVTATVANGGDVLKPYVVSRIINHAGETVYQGQRTLVRHVPVSARNMEEVRKAMRYTTTNGTGKIVDFPQVQVASKTGSAQTHGSKLTHGWFVCFAPYDHPTIAIAAIVEHGGHGAGTAGHVARAMLQTYFHLPVTPEKSAKSD
ncbi:penicillin-binding protein 2 [Capsulimonas corticalis]|uniref:Penicillin-binding protein 2 n=1 Tax=Capsulimonas corticalis TaxID=2219043 RepID=A0A402CSM8_9BACT|nr:penicillin-binding protein 2 [Capsulimonas corticalis]BDI31029.1 penicillin-binding protein 2 [Capsulimonas corticalis]